jgi:hypothetical protein
MILEKGIAQHGCVTSLSYTELPSLSQRKNLGIIDKLTDKPKFI